MNIGYDEAWVAVLAATRERLETEMTARSILAEHYQHSEVNRVKHECEVTRLTSENYRLLSEVSALSTRYANLLDENAKRANIILAAEGRLEAYKRDVANLRLVVTRLEQEKERVEKALRKDPEQQAYRDLQARHASLEISFTSLQQTLNALRDTSNQYCNERDAAQRELHMAQRELHAHGRVTQEEHEREVALWRERALSCGWTNFEAPKSELHTKLKAEHPEWSDEQIEEQLSVSIRFKNLEL